MVSQKTAYLTLILIIVLAAIIRFIGLTQNPPGLNWDEVSHGYNAYSLLHTGRDQWSSVFPVFNFRAYGDYPATLNVYMTVASVALLGPTDFAVRLPHALIGILTVLVGYITAVRWQRNRLWGLAVAFILAFSPWTFFLSRQVLQANWSIFLLTLGLALYFSNSQLAALSVWGLSLFAYHNTRIFTPLLLLLLLGQKKIRSNKKSLILVFILLLTGGIILWFSQSRARSNWVGILDQGAVSGIESLRNHSSFPPLLNKILFNRPVYMLVNAVQNYAGYFSPVFLFFSGGTQYQFSLPGFGVLNPALLPFFYFGIYLLVRKRQWFILGWLLLSPLPAAITRDRYAVVRATAMIPVVVLTCIQGFTHLWGNLKSNFRAVFLLAFLGVYGLFTYTYAYSYVVKYPVFYSQSWQSANLPLVRLAQKLFPEYDQIIITKKYGEPHEFILWYWPYNPAAYQTDPGLKWNYHDNWYWVDEFSKFVFVNDWELRDVARSLPPGKKYLIFSGADSRPDGAQIGRIDFYDGQPAYIVTAI